MVALVENSKIGGMTDNVAKHAYLVSRIFANFCPEFTHVHLLCTQIYTHIMQ